MRIRLKRATTDTAVVKKSHSSSGQALQFLLNPEIVFISSSVSSKSNTCNNIKKTQVLIHRSETGEGNPRLYPQKCWLITWKFSWMRWGVTDLGIAITFLWTWKRISTWERRRDSYRRTSFRTNVFNAQNCLICNALLFQCQYLSRCLIVLFGDGLNAGTPQKRWVIWWSPAMKTAFY